MLGLLGTIFGSIFSGGATGIIGVIAQRYADYKNRQLDMQAQNLKYEHERGLRKLDAEIMAQEWAARTKVAEVEAAGKEAVADAEAFAESYKLEPGSYSERVKPSRAQGWLLIVLDLFRGLVRPALTVYLCAITTLVYIEARQLLGSQSLGADQAMQLINMIVGTILYLTTTCVLWWFGTRNKNAAPAVK